MKKLKNLNAVSFLVVGNTKEVGESQGFKRYVGLAGCHVLAVNPKKEERDKIMGFESPAEPEYVKKDDQGTTAMVDFIVKTDPKTNNGIELTQHASFFLRPEPAYNKDKTKVQVIDQYGNFAWADAEIAKQGGALPNVQKLDKYRMACVGECALVDFLKKYLGVGDAYDYKNSSWVKKDEAQANDCLFTLEHLSDYFKGDFSELKEAIALQPNSKIKLLFGVRTTDEGKQRQTVCTHERLMLSNAASAQGADRLAKELARMKEAGFMATTDYRVQELAEYDVQPSNLSNPILEAGAAAVDSSEKMPWD